jgi:hypothetical protein
MINMRKASAEEERNDEYEPFYASESKKGHVFSP